MNVICRVEFSTPRKIENRGLYSWRAASEIFAHDLSIENGVPYLPRILGTIFSSTIGRYPTPDSAGATHLRCQTADPELPVRKYRKRNPPPPPPPIWGPKGGAQTENTWPFSSPSGHETARNRENRTHKSPARPTSVPGSGWVGLGVKIRPLVSVGVGYRARGVGWTEEGLGAAGLTRGTPVGSPA